MKVRSSVVALACSMLLVPTLWAQTKTEVMAITHFDFEKDAQGWDYVNGAEFPGAKGSLAFDPTLAHGGKGSLKLSADLTGGGAYVGCFRNLWELKDEDFKEIHLWIKSDNVANIGIRIIDSTDQCHQKNGGINLAKTPDWQEVVLNVSDLVGGEHWGGANDGKWHGPTKGFGINVGKTSFTDSNILRGSINIDDVATVAGSVVEGHPTVLPAVLGAPSVRPGFEIPITYRWDAEPMGSDYKVFVHGMTPDGKMAFQADHDPATATSIWAGKVEYKNAIYVPIDTPEGEYRIVVGLYRGPRVELKAGEGVTIPKGETYAYQVATVKVDANAPLSALPAPTLNLDGYVVTFEDQFKDMSISEAGPGTRWFTATKENFGDARFMPQKDGFPFSIVNGILPNKPVLRIEAAKKDGVWCGGIIASANPKGNGFSQKLGYFEMRAKFPKSQGMWPAFWLLGQPSLTDKTKPNPELDVVEFYGILPNLVISTSHVWFPDGRHPAKQEHMVAPGMTDDFHRYGVMVEDDFITYYFDGIAYSKNKTAEEAKVPLYMLVNLAMGGGWPIDKAVSPSYMYVDYVKVYARK